MRRRVRVALPGSNPTAAALRKPIIIFGIFGVGVVLAVGAIIGQVQWDLFEGIKGLAAVLTIIVMAVTGVILSIVAPGWAATLESTQHFEMVDIWDDLDTRGVPPDPAPDPQGSSHGNAPRPDTRHGLRAARRNWRIVGKTGRRPKECSERSAPRGGWLCR